MVELELWGGHECTVNRIGDRFFDQTRRSGHQERIGDLELFAGLGVRALRYPVLWERVAPGRPDEHDWRWSDERLERMRTLNLRPIVGLIHHGSGPCYTNLLDAAFPAGLAAHARAVAERYTDVRDWTPVNEPLTTARFSALYGLWYPHKQDERAFWLALLNQIDATRLAMAEIRRINPKARLIQTEDLGRTYSTPPVAHQASFDNERRWVTWDLLAGRVVRDHALWERLVRFGFEDRLRRIADEPCPPDVIGVNHYLTSDRFLDHRWGDYPEACQGGNAFMQFADVEAVRVLAPGPDGLGGVLEEAWSRYAIPLAVTESHLGCTRENQMRWVREAWETVQALRARGAQIEAVTAWALLGSFDWNSLLTKDAGHYEPGVFDVRGPVPRPTALAQTLKALAAGQKLAHPAALGEGWWRRDVRLSHRPVFRPAQDHRPRPGWSAAPPCAAPLLITGATGVLGQALARSCEWRGLSYVLTSRSDLSLDDSGSIEAALDRHRPWAVVNAAGWVDVDAAEDHAAACFGANTRGAVRLAKACRDRDVPFVGFSSDLVFDGRTDAPYRESAAPKPLSVYGLSKAEAERQILVLGGCGLMIRTAAFFSPFDPHNFAAHVVRQLVNGHEVEAADDLIISPTYVPDLVDGVLDLLIDGETGLWHLVNQGALSWAAFAVKIAKGLSADVDLIKPKAWRELGRRGDRPRFAAMTSERGLILPSLENALERYVEAVGDIFQNGASIDIPDVAPTPMQSSLACGGQL